MIVAFSGLIGLLRQPLRFTGQFDLFGKARFG